jgi:hypothetical protein
MNNEQDESVHLTTEDVERPASNGPRSQTADGWSHAAWLLVAAAVVILIVATLLHRSGTTPP